MKPAYKYQNQFRLVADFQKFKIKDRSSMFHDRPESINNINYAKQINSGK